MILSPRSFITWACVALVVLAQVPRGQAGTGLCCKRTQLQCEYSILDFGGPYMKICADCSNPKDWPGAYCATGKCNPFGCNCEGECRSVPGTTLVRHDLVGIMNECSVSACQNVGLDPPCMNDYPESQYQPLKNIIPGSPLAEYCSSIAQGGRKLLQSTMNDTETPMTPYETCEQELVQKYNTTKFTTRDQILENFMCLSMEIPRVLRILKEEACVAVGAETCNLPDFGSYFDENGVAIPEKFDASLKDVKVASSATFSVFLVSCVISLVLCLA